MTVQTASPAARKTTSTAAPAIVSCHPLAADRGPARSAPHSAQNFAPETAFVPQREQNRTAMRRAILTETDHRSQLRQFIAAPITFGAANRSPACGFVWTAAQAYALLHVAP